MERHGIKAYFTVPLGGAGIALVLLLPFKALGLSLGDGPDHLTVGLFLCVLALLAVGMLAAEGYSKMLAFSCLLPIGLALFLRLLCFDHITLDYQDFLAHWAASFRTGGGFSAVKEHIGNYNVPYLYFLAAISYLKLPDLYAIKLFSVLFDIVLAWGGLRLARALCGKKSLRPLIAFCLLLLLPTVIHNGAYWGQCDSIYAALLMHAAASGLEDRPVSSVLFLAVAFSFKLQSIFVIPFWCILWYAGRVKFKHLLLFPVGYTATIAPALLMGKPLGDILGVYVGQMGEYTQALTLNAPSVFSLIPPGIRLDAQLASRFGILAAFVMTLAVLALLFPLRVKLDNEILLTALIILAVGIPFLLPYMHERYFFAADTLTLVWACTDTGHIFQAAGIQAASLGGYHAYLRLRYAFPLTLLGYSIPMGIEAMIVLLVLLSAAVILGQKIGHTHQ